MQVNLYVRRDTPAHHPNPPVIAKRGDEWLQVNGHRITRLSPPAAESLVPLVNTAAHRDTIRRIEAHA